MNGLELDASQDSSVALTSAELQAVNDVGEIIKTVRIASEEFEEATDEIETPTDSYDLDDLKSQID